MNLSFAWFPQYSGLFFKSYWLTVRLALFAIVLGTILGVVVGILVTTKIKPVRWIMRIYIELLRGCPLLVQLFMVYFGFPYMGINISLNATTIAVFTLYSGAYIAEITRSGIESIPTGQWEAAKSLGLNYPQTMIRIILPQTLKLALSSLVGFYTGMIKDTSLASIIGYGELVKKAQSIMSLTGQPFTTYIAVGLCYFIICFPLSKLVGYIERKTIK